ncbi:MAG TPA: ABC transporter permease [Pyrinomonadaceae bacterium]|nr:ABC transporter permease [Pyrinomonadaceae bacterium]
MLQDLRLGLRMLFKSPGFSAIIVMTLALGIGANVALFSVVNGVLLNPLPFPQPEQLVTIDQSKPNFDMGAVPYPNFLDLQKENTTFTAMAIHRGFGFSLVGAGEPERVAGRLVSAEMFSVLDVKPVLGRPFTPDEDRAGANAVVIISGNLWQRKFGGAPDVVGRGITLDDRSYEIVGVLPPNFSLFRTTDVFVPIEQWDGPALKVRAAGLGLHGIGRLKPGVSIEQGQADLERIMQNLAATYPATNKGNGAKVSPLKARIIGDIATLLWVLLGAVGFVLLIACVNVSNLLLARSTGRTREFAIRAALGAGQWRLFRQTLTESLLLSFIGGSLGLLVASWGTHAALAMLPTTLPRATEIALDSRVLIFAVGMSLLAGILSGVAPALKASRRRLSETLKEGGRGASTRGRAHGVLVAVEMGLAVVLLIGAGLMIRSLAVLWNVDPGFRADNMLTFGLSLSPSMRTAEPEAIRSSLRELSDQLGSTAGVEAVSFSGGAIPLVAEDDVFFWTDLQAKPASQAEMNMALIYRVEPGYLKAMGIPLKQGRFFTEQDDGRSGRVVVIDEVLARKHFGDVNPIGRRIYMDEQEPQQIIGVIGHVKQWSLDSNEAQTLQAQLYEPFREVASNWAGIGVLARFAGGEPPFDAIRRVVQTHNNQNVISRPQTMNEVIGDSFADRRFSMILLEAFAIVALLLASLGLYGVISYLVGQRTHELGIRLALGAQRLDVFRLVLSHGMKLALAGVALGLVAAFGLTRLLANMLYGVSATDPVTFTAIALLLTAVALLACIVPARRATKVDPVVALRYE